MTPWRDSETLGEVIERNLSDHAHKTALLYQGRSFSYCEYGTRARRLANALYDRGVRRQHRVAILAQNSNAHLEA
ncbi:MAG: AMP-binding protein, partial [Candidatus Eiseniibacteriota bacterium]